MTVLDTDYAVPTGDFILEWLEDHDMSPAELARRTGYSRKHISLVTRGTAAVTPDFATRLELVTGIPAVRWLALEAQYQADHARLGIQLAAAERKDVLDAFAPSLTYLRKHGWVKGTRRNPGALLLELMMFFGVGTPDALIPSRLTPQVAFLQSDAFVVEEASIATWLRLAQIEAAAAPAQAPYDHEALRALLPSLRSMSRSLPTEPMAFVSALAHVGVKLLAVPEVPGCRAYGATFWQDDRPVVVLSARGKNDGVLWFSLFHELGHVLLHPRTTSVEVVNGEESKREDEANKFASETLIPRKLRPELHAVASKEHLTELAERESVSPGVLLQHLHHEKLWPYDRGRSLFTKVEVLPTSA